MAYTDFFVMKKSTGEIHRVGSDTHDAIWVDDKGVLHYYNMQNGDGCTGEGFVNGYDNGYAFIPGRYGVVVQPGWCLLESQNRCRYPIAECAECPLRKVIEDQRSSKTAGGRYRNKETGKLYTFREMLKEWREKYEGINPETGLFQYHWHTRYEYIPEEK